MYTYTHTTRERYIRINLCLYNLHYIIVFVGTTEIIIYLGIRFNSNPEILMHSFVFNDIDYTTTQCMFCVSYKATRIYLFITFNQCLNIKLREETNVCIQLNILKDSQSMTKFTIKHVNCIQIFISKTI